eukprot:366438-Chlamydomonas_euryale.AAC.6
MPSSPPPAGRRVRAPALDNLTAGNALNRWHHTPSRARTHPHLQCGAWEAVHQHSTLWRRARIHQQRFQQHIPDYLVRDHVATRDDLAAVRVVFLDEGGGEEACMCGGEGE